MPEHLRALVVLLVLATAVFLIAKAPACALASTTEDFDRRRNLWIGITLILFLSHNFWIYIVLAGALLLHVQAKEQNKVAMYLFVLLAVPAIPGKIPGMGVVNFLFDVHYIRLLALTVLLPAYLYLRKQPDVEPFGRLLPDKLIAGFLLLSPFVMMEHAPFTSTLRHGVFYPFVDVFLPYYVASRGLRSLQGFRDALLAFVVAGLILGATLAFEFTKQWLLYHPLESVLGQHWGYGQYLMRGANLRASATTGHAIAGGFVISVVMGIFLYLRTLITKPKLRGLTWLLLLAGSIAPVSRGPWVGAAAMLLVFIATSPAPVRGFVKLGLVGVVLVPLLLVTPMGGRIIDHLPIVGTVEADNVTARQLLAEVSTQVILENPFFGRFDFIENPMMQALRGQDGIIDLVNTYVIVGLSKGLVGLAFFAGTFLAAVFGIYRGMWGLADKNDERYTLGRSLLATLIGIMVIIGTVNPIEVIEATFWTVAGLGVAYARMLAREQSTEAEGFGKSRSTTARAPI